MAHRNRWFTELKNRWIFPWQTVSHNQMVQPLFILFEHMITYSDEAAHQPELYRLTWLGKRAGGYGDDQHCWALSSPGSDRLFICVCSMGIVAKSPEVFLPKSRKFQGNIGTPQGNI